MVSVSIAALVLNEGSGFVEGNFSLIAAVSNCNCYWITLALIKSNDLISNFRHRQSCTNQLGHLTYVLSLTFAFGGVLSQIKPNANVLTIHTNLTQRLSAVLVAVAGHEIAIGSPLVAYLIQPVTSFLA